MCRMNIKIEWTCIEAIQEAGWPICQDCGQDLDFSVGVSNV